jgi:hypothetical protein
MERGAVLCQILVAAFVIALQFEHGLLANDIHDPFRLATIIVSAAVLCLATLCTLKSAYLLSTGVAAAAVWYASQVGGLALSIAAAIVALVVLICLRHDSTRLIQWSVVLAILSLLAVSVALNLLYVHTRDLTELSTVEMYGGLAVCLLLVGIHVIGVFAQRPKACTPTYTHV